MRRGSTGQYEISRSAGEQVRAFVPQPLPPEPAVNLSSMSQRMFDACRLDVVIVVDLKEVEYEA